MANFDCLIFQNHQDNLIRLSRIIVCALVLLICIQPVISIKCWSCRSDTDPKCADPFDNKTLPIYDCDEVKFNNPIINPNSKPTMCRKIRQKVKGKWQTIRSCALLGEVGEGTGNEHHCLIRRGTYDIYLEYCTCNSKDGCNSSGSLLPVKLLSLVTFILTAVWILKR